MTATSTNLHTHTVTLATQTAPQQPKPPLGELTSTQKRLWASASLNRSKENVLVIMVGTDQAGQQPAALSRVCARGERCGAAISFGSVLSLGRGALVHHCIITAVHDAGLLTLGPVTTLVSR
jgi:hypothetical protein